MNNILIPMAGAGSRFSNAGYSQSKPLIDVNGLPMIVRVLDNLPVFDNYVFIVRKDMHDLIRLKNLLIALKPNAHIIEIDEITRGAAETCLFAEQFINNDEPLLIANCDQIHIWNSNHFAATCLDSNVDGVIVTFKSSLKNNSYVSLNDQKMVINCVEKIVISDNATTGAYFWRKGSDFVRYTKQMISKNIRTNNEFYVCPVYNEIIQNNGQITIYPINAHWPIGTPEDLQRYIEYVNR